MPKRDIVANIYFFMNVPIKMSEIHGHRRDLATGSYVEMTADMGVLCVIRTVPRSTIRATCSISLGC